MRTAALALAVVCFPITASAHVKEYLAVYDRLDDATAARLQETIP